MNKTASTPFTHALAEGKWLYGKGRYKEVHDEFAARLHDWPAGQEPIASNPEANEEAKQMLLLQMLCLTHATSTDGLLQHAYHWVGRYLIWYKLEIVADAGSELYKLAVRLKNFPTKDAIKRAEEFLGIS